MGKWGILLLIGLPAMALAGTPEGPCDAKGMANVRRAIAQVDASMKGLIAAQGIGEACGGALPGPIARALSSVNRVVPSDRVVIVARGMADAVEFSSAACPDFQSVFKHVASVAPKDKARLLYAQCGYAKLGLASEKEYRAAGEKNLALALLGPSLFKWLWANGMDREAARGLIRAMMSL